MTYLSLFPFQEEDVDYLQDQKAVLIANEMGTGKTYEAIERDLRLREKHSESPSQAFQHNTLVVAPLTTLDSTWKHHVLDLTQLNCTVIDPKDRIGSYDEFLMYGGVFCVHWEALRLMPELQKLPWLHIIADECHRAKNRSAQQTKALKKIQDVKYKTAMSGTPVVNRPDELWSILNWLYPKTYTSYWNFFKKYVDSTIEFGGGGRRYQKILGPKNTEELRRQIRPFFVRRRKVDVLKDLPDKYYTTINVDLDPQQRRVYNMMKKDMIAWIGEQEDEVLPAPVVVAQLTRLQQFSCAYAELNPEDGRVRLREPSSKIDALMEVLDGSTDQVVVFSRFKQLIRLVERRLVKAGISHVVLTGDTPQEERGSVVLQFQRGDARVFAGSIAAGGVGITLHAASTVVFLDRDWSPALNSQAEDRLHRIGQKSAVQVIDIMAKNTVDLGRMQRLELKKSWIRQILGDK
jgi:SNF2 family DNA or RNA helicase